MCLYFYLNSIFLYEKIENRLLYRSITTMKDSYWVYMKDNMLFSVSFIIEVGMIPFYTINSAYERTKQKMEAD